MLTQRLSDAVSDLAGDENDPRHSPQSAAAGFALHPDEDLLLLFAPGAMRHGVARAWELD